MTQLQNVHFYSEKDLRNFPKQEYKKYRNENKLNPYCEHVIRNGQAITLTQEQKEQFARIICDVPKNPIGGGVICGFVLYWLVAPNVPIFVLSMASAFKKTQAVPQITALLYVIGVVLLLLVIGGFVGGCIAVTKKNKKSTEAFCAEVGEKIRRGDYRACAYRIEEIYHTKTITDINNESYGYIGFWYRIGDILIGLPNNDCEFDYDPQTEEITLNNPRQFELCERSHPVGGYIVGMLICLDGQEHFYGI